MANLTFALVRAALVVQTPWRPERFLIPFNEMKRQDIMQPKKRGRPAIGKGMPVQVRLQPADLAALDAYRTSAESMTRPQAIRAALKDWLRTHGFASTGAPKPKGPATDVVEKMDAAITKDRTKSSDALQNKIRREH